MLGIGLVMAGVFGAIFADGYRHRRLRRPHLADGFESMVEITLLSLLVGGLGALMKATGGLAWLATVIDRFARGHKSRRAGEVSIATLSAATDVFTANNTVAILISGGLARDIAQQHGVPPARAASVMDIFACVTQGVLPYGAQILLAASLGKVSAFALVGQVHYSWLLGAVTIVAMLWSVRGSARGRQRRKRPERDVRKYEGRGSLRALRLSEASRLSRATAAWPAGAGIRRTATPA